jgi:hypothetical protein
MTYYFSLNSDSPNLATNKEEHRRLRRRSREELDMLEPSALVLDTERARNKRHSEQLRILRTDLNELQVAVHNIETASTAPNEMQDLLAEHQMSMEDRTEKWKGVTEGRLANVEEGIDVMIPEVGDLINRVTTLEELGMTINERVEKDFGAPGPALFEGREDRRKSERGAERLCSVSEKSFDSEAPTYSEWPSNARRGLYEEEKCNVLRPRTYFLPQGKYGDQAFAQYATEDVTNEPRYEPNDGIPERDGRRFLR